MNPPTPELIALAIKIADEAAAHDIEIRAPECGDHRRGYWYEPAATPPEYQEDVDLAVEYLTLRGFLKRDGNLVAIDHKAMREAREG